MLCEDLADVAALLSLYISKPDCSRLHYKHVLLSRVIGY